MGKNPNEKAVLKKPSKVGRQTGWGNPTCGTCGAQSRQKRSQQRICENGHTFTWKLLSRHKYVR